MNPKIDQTHMKDLLIHAAWLRRLAGHLVHGDDALAEDVVQQTWLAALFSPPDPDRPAQPWLAQVLRNFIRRNARDRKSRGLREAEGGHLSQEGTSPETLLASAEAQRDLVQRVIALEEPYRSAILLRYYQGYEPTEIANKLGIPAGTVRWRVREGIRQLRTNLDAAEAKTVKNWRRALLPPAAMPAVNTLLKGILVIMSTKAKLSIGAMILATLLGLGSLIWQHSTAPSSLVAQPHDSYSFRHSENSVQKAKLPHKREPAAHMLALGKRDAGPPRLAALAPSLTTEEPIPRKTRGKIVRDDLRSTILRIMPAIKGCYEKLLAREPNAGGRIVFRFALEGKEGVGRVTEATVIPKEYKGGEGNAEKQTVDRMWSDHQAIEELADVQTEACIQRVVSHTDFPAPQGGHVVIFYPFNFVPTEE